jgi:outer membrane protein assembly complex protein YaeT
LTRVRRLIVLLALAALSLPVAPARAQIDLGEDEPQVKRVEISGNLAYDEKTLKSLIRTRGKSFFRPWRDAPLRSDFLRFDQVVIQDFYRRHGYLSARVESVVVDRASGDEVSVRFALIEGPRAFVQSIDFSGPSAAEEEILRDVIPLSAGRAFDYPQLEVSRLSIDSVYAERGHVATAIRDSIERVGDDVRVRFEIDPGPVAILRSTVVEGTQATKPGFVSREVTLRPGETLARSKLLRSQQRIYDSGFYNDVEFATGAIDPTTRETDLIVSVRERRQGWVDAGVGYGTEDQARLTAQVGQRNLFRDGVRGVLTGRLGIRAKTKPQFPYAEDLFVGKRRVDVALSRDWLLGFHVRGTIGAYAEKVPSFETETEIPLSAFGASGGLRYELSRWSNVSLLYEVRRVESDSTRLVTQVGNPLARYTTNRIILSVGRDTRLDLFDPRRGSVVTAAAEFAGGVLRGNSQFLKISSSATAYRPRGAWLTLAARGRGGLLTSRGQGPAEGFEDQISDLDLIPEDDRFRTGGGSTVRGYQEDEIGTIVVFTDSAGVVTRKEEQRGGAYLIQVNAEVRARMTGFLGAAVFVDGGGVWERVSDLSLRRFFSLANGAGYKDMRWTAGAGIRFATPVGPVRLDYGWKLRMARSDQPDAATGRGAFAFSLGQAF